MSNTISNVQLADDGSVVCLSCEVTPTVFEVAALLQTLLPAGAVLISSRAPVGYCAVASNPMVTNQGFRSLVLSGDVDCADEANLLAIEVRFHLFVEIR